MDATIIDQAIRIDKPTPRRVIVSALQIIQPRFRVVDVSAVAQGVLFAEGCCQRAGGGQRIAPCVVGVGHDARAAGIVAVGDIRPGLAHPRELAAVLPCVGPRAIAQKVADLVRRQTLAVDAREQVAPEAFFQGCLQLLNSSPLCFFGPFLGPIVQE